MPGPRLPLAGVLRLNRPSDIWFKPALSVVAAVAPPNLLLLALGRLDLAMYTMAGSLCALYAHHRPYAARAGVLARVVLGMTGGLAVALVAASLTTNAVVLVTVGALLAAAQKALCDATRLGPPANVVLTFISSASLFVPQTLGQVPGHLALALAAGAWAWIVGMAPGLARPHGPERRATAHALTLAAGYAERAGGAERAGYAGHAGSRAADAPRARAAAAAGVHAAWQTLLSVRGDETRLALERLVVRAEAALATPVDADPARLRAWARDLRGTRPLPRPGDLPDGDRADGDLPAGERAAGGRVDGHRVGGGRMDSHRVGGDRVGSHCVGGDRVGSHRVAGDRMNGHRVAGDRMNGHRVGGDRVDDDELLGLLGAEAERAAGQPPLWRRLGPSPPIAVRTAVGCALAGYASLALGVGRPYWALVTAASLYQANVTLTWNRAVQRVVGNLAGVLAFAALVPLAHAHRAALVLVCLALNFGAEALISRNYWLGSVCVTPMALLITEFAQYQDSGRLITERVVDTLVGAAVGFVAAVAVTNRRAGDRLGPALTAVEGARDRAAHLLTEPRPAPTALESARRGLAAALVDLRTTADTASGEWWQRALPEERVVTAERSAHRTLAATVRRQGLHPARNTHARAEDVRR